MKTLIVNRNIIVSIFAVMLLVYGVQGISYAQGSALTITPGETNTTIRVNFRDTFYAYDEKSYQVQLRQKGPKGDWILKCGTIQDFFDSGVRTFTVIFTGLEPGTTYQARWREANQPNCAGNPPNPDPWSPIGEGTTFLETPSRVEFVDANLARTVRNRLRLYTVGADLLKIPEAELTKLTHLKINNDSDTPMQWRISNLTGLEHATQLSTLSLQYNNLRDITPLAQLAQLTQLDLGDNNISDITPLAQLTQLTQLDLEGNDVSDITPLAQLTQLTRLFLGRSFHGNDISDITPLAQLTQLRVLRLGANSVSSLTPLAQLTQLTDLNLKSNDISDITPLAQLTQLTWLRLDGNNIDDITPLAQLIQLMELYLADNNINDIAALAQLTQLTQLDLSVNNISDVTPITELVSLEWLFLLLNPIEDTYPLNALLEANPDVYIDIGIIREEGGPTITVSTVQPLTGSTLDGAVVKLTLSSGAFDKWISGFRDAFTISGIPGIDIGRYGTDAIEVVSDTEVKIKLIFEGDVINTDFVLTLTVGPKAVTGYNSDAYMLEIPVTGVTEAELSQAVVASAPYLLTATTLHGSIVTLKLNGAVFDVDKYANVNVSGIPEVTIAKRGLRRAIRRISDTEITVELRFLDNITEDATLIFTVASSAIDRYNGPPLTAEIPVSATTEVEPTGELVASTASPLTKATLDGSAVTLTLQDKSYELGRGFSAAGGGVRVLGVPGVTVRGFGLGVFRLSDTEVSVRLNFGGDFDDDKTLTFLVSAEVIANYSGPPLAAELPVAANAETPTTPQIPISDATLKFFPSPVQSPAVGEQLTLSLNIANGESVAAYQATVQFDDTALRYISSAIGDYLPAGAFPLPVDASGNTVTIGAVSLAGESNGDGTLATITFEVIEVKKSTVTLSDVILSDSAETAIKPQVEDAQIIEPSQLNEDVNGDGDVNILDLVRVAGQLGQSGQNSADVNGDGIVNILDLVAVAAALGNAAAAPSAWYRDLEIAPTRADVGEWLAQAQGLDLTDATSQRGVLFLEQLLAVLTPKETMLLPNYPNPFNPETWIPYQLATDADVTLAIHALDGQLIRRLALGYQVASTYNSRSRAAYWDGKNDFGEPVASGVYFYTLTAGDFTATRKMLIRK